MMKPLFAGLAVLVLAGPALAGPEVNTTTGVVYADGKPGAGLAVHGYDVVAYQTLGQPTLGLAKFAASHGAAIYRFASEANLAAFKADPEKYVPAYGGYCAYGVSVGAKFDGDPTYWKVVDGKLYLNLDGDIQKLWLKDVPGAIAKATTNWTRIADLAPADIR